MNIDTLNELLSELQCFPINVESQYRIVNILRNHFYKLKVLKELKSYNIFEYNNNSIDLASIDKNDYELLISINFTIIIIIHLYSYDTKQVFSISIGDNRDVNILFSLLKQYIEM